MYVPQQARFPPHMVAQNGQNLPPMMMRPRHPPSNMMPPPPPPGYQFKHQGPPMRMPPPNFPPPGFTGTLYFLIFQRVSKNADNR